MCRMRLVQAHMADLVIVVIKNRDLVRLLENLYPSINKHEGQSFRPTLVAGVGSGGTAYLDFAVLFYCLGSLRLQDGIAVIANDPTAVAGAAHYRPRTRKRRLDTEIGAAPYP